MLRVVAIFLVIIMYCSQFANAEDVMLKRSKPYIPVLKSIMTRHWESAPSKHFIPAQVEQESWWRPNAKLETSRELGRGLAQLTITSRFNAYEEALKSIPALRKWDWQSDPYSVQYQLTYMVITDRKNYAMMSKLVDDEESAWACALVSYNAGPGTVLKRNAAAKAQGVNDRKWFGGMELAKLNNEDRLLYGRSLWGMRNEYPRLIIKVRSPKYRSLFYGD